MNKCCYKKKNETTKRFCIQRKKMPLNVNSHEQGQRQKYKRRKRKKKNYKRKKKGVTVPYL